MAVSGAHLKSGWPKVEGPGEQLRCTCSLVKKREEQT